MIGEILGTEKLIKGRLQLSRIYQKSGFQNSVPRHKKKLKQRGILLKEKKKALNSRGNYNLLKTERRYNILHFQ